MKPKEFDCVRMKYDIQERLAREFAGLSQEEQRRRTEAIIAGDPLLARFWGRAHPIGEGELTK
ncbi:MAG: hypothetical protein IT449_06735 [Phycisphaerales bacterium]|nr:hypothetical protein [Phycisphaerales bacterium]